jgi:hypothetical protein
MGEIADVVRRHAESEGLNPVQSHALDLTYTLAHGIANGDRECTHDNVQLAVTLLCSACKPGLASIGFTDCSGRHDWRHPCDLISQSVLVDCTAS